ncbi:hypothetical protein LXL04_017593 [Taraxacum kok-saghyz]
MFTWAPWALTGESRQVVGGGVRSRIVGSINQLQRRAIITSISIAKLIGGESLSKFWLDKWCGDNLLSVLFPRLFCFSPNSEDVVHDLREQRRWIFRWRRDIWGGEEHLQFSNSMELLDLISFSSQPATRHIDDLMLPDVANISTRWNRFTILDRLHVRVKLEESGIDLDIVLFPVCNDVQEIVSHCPISCLTVLRLGKRVFAWLQLDVPLFISVVEMTNWINSGLVRRLDWCTTMESICMTIISNAKVFRNTEFRKHHIFDKICKYVFNWFASRNSVARMPWVM